LIGDYTASLLIGSFSKPVYMAVNSLIFLIVVINISIFPRLLQGKPLIDRFSCLMLWISFLLYWLCNPNLGQTSFWLVGSAIYLWPLMWLSFYLICLFKLLREDVLIPNCNNNKKLALLAVLGFCSGLSNESTGSATVFLNSMLLFMNWDNFRGLSLRNSFLRVNCKDSLNFKVMLVGFFSSLIGFLILVLAPGNFLRMTHEAFVHWRSLPLVYKIFGHVVMRMPDAISQFGFAFIIISVLFITLSRSIAGCEKLKIQCYIIAATFLTHRFRF